ncbi:Ferritin Dps family protein [Desulfurobacterium thermolithotrophum DSM 11699]|uniref:Ferritin Dps family protein n=1 Tax=Desulfurobacterium thermolithotrophum (strain DSM 11699 / BSA) TaxID=868864 RepID=F0S378_DESTD|nr:ferritin-like domain-containing protein [Desulfurobacterium thermolithotrophum]ADY73300.1 Ferritin Dps family protein [Desulfurobacterium thermolithotrophum DSM 11699]
MGTKGRELVGEHADKIIELLNKALCDEWLAYYQYWIGSKVVKGPMKDAVIAELIQHANDELRHADMLVTRILELGGTPVLSPKQWFELTNCGYDAPVDPFVKIVLEQNIKGEQCAIDTYSEILKITKDIDPITYNIALQILTDEVEHEEDLQSFLEDLENLKFLK